MAAKKKPVEVLTLADLGVTADNPDAARSIMLTVAEEPPREAGVKIIDEGDVPARSSPTSSSKTDWRKEQRS